MLSLDVPVPQMVDQLPDIVHFFAALSPDPEQVIEVPKISFDRVSQRLVERRLPQMVEQLVEVPTVLTPTRIALQIAEQLVAIPVPQVSVSGGGHQGSLSGQGSVGEQIVDIPVPRGRGKRRVYGSLPEQGTTAQTVEQIVDIPSGGVCGPGSSSAGFYCGVFRTFPHGKKVRSAGQVSADLPRHVSSWTPPAYDVSVGPEEEVDELLAIPLELRTPVQRARLLSSSAPLPRRGGGRGRRGGRGGRLVPPLFLAALVVDNDSGLLAMLVSLVMMHLALCSLLAFSGPRCSALWPAWSRRTAAVVWQGWYCC